MACKVPAATPTRVVPATRWCKIAGTEKVTSPKEDNVLLRVSEKPVPSALILTRIWCGLLQLMRGKARLWSLINHFERIVFVKYTFESRV
jgi:hypothetical protein